jgi:uncharacterized protein YbjT (DUF2867 family)
MHPAMGRVLLTGATGYVGGRLLRKLEESGLAVRCMVRRPEALSGRAAEQTEIVQGDVLEPASLQESLAGVTVAYYLVHSMAASEPFAGADRRGAENFAAAARESGVGRIVYLGGLGADQDLSTHLESRHEVGRILRESGVPTIEFRASVVIGSGSVSFEIVRGLVDRSPLLLMPRWVVSRTQPIGIEDVLAYLLAALTVELEESRLFEIGGPDRVAYADLMREYARQVGLRRAVIRVPFATPRISGLCNHVSRRPLARSTRPTVDDLADRLCRELRLRQEARCRARGDEIREVGLGVGRGQDDRRRIALPVAILGQVPRELQAALLAEEDVDQDDVGTQGLEQTERLGIGRGDGDDAQTFPLQEYARNLEERFVVVDDQTASGHELSVAPIRMHRIAASRNPTRRGTRAPRSVLPAMTAQRQETMVPVDPRNSNLGVDR